MITFKIYYNFQVCNTVLLTVVTSLYFRLSELVYLITRSLYPSTHISPYPPPTAPGNHPPTSFLWAGHFQILHISENIVYVSFSIWFTSLSIMPSKSIHIVPKGRIFSFYGSIFHFMHIPRFLYAFIHPQIVGYFPASTIVNNASVNGVGVQISLPDTDFIAFSIHFHPEVKLMDYIIVLF